MLTKLSVHWVSKPWGRTDIPASFDNEHATDRIGEIWFQREGGENDALLAKYLFTSERLSVQVHPDDDSSRDAGQARGKDEAWLVLDADPAAEIAIGVKRTLSRKDLRNAALDGSIVDELDWRPVRPGDAFYSPAGTLHSIGAGLTLLEIQQNCDVTYRLYDFGRPRELHLDEGVSAAKPGLEIAKSVERQIGGGRSVLVSGPKFTVERWRRSPQTPLQASADQPLWLIPLGGEIQADGRKIRMPSVWIAEGPVLLEIGGEGDLLVAYEGGELRDLV